VLHKLEKPKPPQCECMVSARWYAAAHRCPFAATYELSDGRKVCTKHARAADNARK
jgi:hypothetical protein